METSIVNHNFKLVNVDTDAISYCNQDGSPIEHETFVKHLEEINSFLPELIVMEDDGEFESFVVVKAKNYIMRANGKDKFKGSGLLSSKTEPILREMIKEVGISLLDNGIDYPELQEIYMKYVNEACNISDAKRWSKKMTLTKAILNAATDPKARTNEKKPWTAIADKNLQEGDKFYVYPVKGDDIQAVVKGEPQFYKTGEPKMKENIILKTADDYDSDEHTPKLLERCYATIKIFSSILDMSNFLDYSKAKNAKLLEEK